MSETGQGGGGRYVVDAMNVIGARPDGWWRDRHGAVRRLHDGLRALATATGDRLVLVVDGRPHPDLPEGEEGGVAVRYARRPGRDAADDRIVELLTTELAPASVWTVVTADRELRDRVVALGAVAEGPRTLLARLRDD